MSITFNKSALIDAARLALKAHDAADVKFQEDAAKYRNGIVADQDKLPMLRALRDELTKFLKTGKQPTADDARRFRAVTGDHDYLRNMYVNVPDDRDVRNNVARPEGWLNPTRVASYRGLIAMLEANTEDTITANQLKLFGYSDLEALFRAAASADGVVLG